MAKPALIFGSIGTIVETSQMQLDAFNSAFSEVGLDWVWALAEYREMLKTSGGRQRIAAYAEKTGDVVDATALHRRKTEIFADMMKEKGLRPRAGVLETIAAAKDAGMAIGFATTTSGANVSAIFDALDGALYRSHFDFVGAAGLVTKGKPDPEIYDLALREMGAVRVGSLAIEDTGVSAYAPLAAGLSCIGFPGAFADPSSFPRGMRLVDALAPDLLGVEDTKVA